MRSQRWTVRMGWGILALVLSFVITTQAYPGATEDAIAFQPHPLPETLAQWQDSNRSGDYFNQIEALKVGHLIWSQFPVKVYIEEPADNLAQDWRENVQSAVWEWNAYLPLKIVEEPDLADIQIFRRRPPLEAGKLRASSAETRYQVYLRKLEDGTQMLAHRFTILLSPTQTSKYIASAARHEFGHALGIWGHSPVESDVMYFSQVREPPPISARDINTLKQIYQQPTRLGWNL